jgi:hypothetical protein
LRRLSHDNQIALIIVDEFDQSVADVLMLDQMSLNGGSDVAELGHGIVERSS